MTFQQSTFTATAYTALEAYGGELNSDWNRPFTGSTPNQALISPAGRVFRSAYNTTFGANHGNGGEHFTDGYTVPTADYVVEAEFWNLGPYGGTGTPQDVPSTNPTPLGTDCVLANGRKINPTGINNNPSAGSYSSALIYARGSLPYSYYGLGYNRDLGMWYLQDASLGGAVLQSTTALSIPDGGVRLAQLVVRGNRIEGWIDGEPLLDVVDVHFASAGFVGLRFDGGSSPVRGLHLDGFRVHDEFPGIEDPGDRSAWEEPRPASGTPTPCMDFIPRWMNANYDDASLLRRIWYAAIPERAAELRSSVEGTSFPSFFGAVSMPRQTYVGRYLQSTGALPRVELRTSHVGAASGFVRLAEGWSAFLFERDRPVALRDRNVLHLQNLAQVTHTVVSTGGVLDLNPYFPGDPPLEDTLFVVYDKWRRRFAFDAADRRVTSGYINIGLTGVFDVSWQSRTLHEGLLAGTSYVTVDGRRTDVVSADVTNAWDEYGRRIGLLRRPGQSNLEMKRRCQQVTVADRPETRISAMLGMAFVRYWASAAGALSLSGERATSAGLMGLGDREPVEETPARDGTRLQLSAEPFGAVQLFLDGLPVDPATFTVSGSTIVPVGALLQSAAEDRILAQYAVRTYTQLASGGFLTSLTAGTLGQRTPLVVVGRGVRVAEALRAVSDWRWNAETGSLKGLAEFD